MDDERDRPEEEGRFKVTDRRLFTPEGDEREGGETAESRRAEPADPGPVAAPEPQPPKRDDEPEPPRQGGEGEQIDFASFVISLATTGMVHMGEIPDPATGGAAVNLDGARQMIDILGILKTKTEGNLSPEESHLLENLLYELRMKFLTKSKAIDL